MYTMFKDVDKLIKEFLGGITIEEVLNATKDSLGDKNQILSQVFAQSKENGVNLIDEELCLITFDMLGKALKIYRDKCRQYSLILHMLSGGHRINQTIIEMYDITLQGEKVLTSDLNRILKPLKRNFELMQETQTKLEDIETYMHMDEKLIQGKKRPNSSMINRSSKPSDEAVAMTSGYLKRIMAIKAELREKINNTKD